MSSLSSMAAISTRCERKNLSTRKADYNKFQDLNVQILGISGNAPFSQKAFADSLQLPYPLLSDMELNAAIKAYGVVSGRQSGGDRSSSWISRESSEGSGSVRT